MANKIFGKWKRGPRIGSGGQATVYEAHSAEGESIKALKLVKSPYTKKRARFALEVRQHIKMVEAGAENIIPILDHNLDEFEREDNVPGYIVMPLAETNLDEEKELLLGRPEICLEIFSGILDGIKHAHDFSVVHRDLKPKNILFLDRSLKNPMVSDFGICFVKETSESDRLTEVNETVGAKFFMAPEQERGGIQDIDVTADIHTLGKLLHHMLTGRNLHREEVENAFNEEELSQLPILSTIRDEILTKCIATDPKDRFQRIEDLQKVVSSIREKFGYIPTGGGQAKKKMKDKDHHAEDDTKKTTETDEELFVLSVKKAYEDTLEHINLGNFASIKHGLDRLIGGAQKKYEVLIKIYSEKPRESRKGAEDFIISQPESVGVALAIARHDVKSLFPEVKRFLEQLTHFNQNKAGHISVTSISHSLAGLIFMGSAVFSLHFESWDYFSELIKNRYEWFFQSGRPLYNYGFGHPYFFHFEAMDRKASDIHDYYRHVLQMINKDNIYGMNNEEIFNKYVQAQMIMSIKGSQLNQKGEGVSFFSDFGRFYEIRVIPLLDRAYSNKAYGNGIAKAFDEDIDEWFKNLDERLQIAKQNLGGTFIWDSITSYEPRG